MLEIRPRRLRMQQSLREMVRETRLSKESLILPLFVKEGENIKSPICSLEGHFHYSCDRLDEAIEEALKAGVHKVLLFGIPIHKDAIGSEAYNPNGVIQEAVHRIKSQYKEMYVITDVCMCEYTDHGHCGILQGHKVDNDKTLLKLQQIALSHAQAGADMIAPSDMMDGRIQAIRSILDQEGFKDTPIMAYSAKYASSFYGPFRIAAHSVPSFGDRKSYQMDYHNQTEAIKEALLDLKEGADLLMVKPALSYLDVIQRLSKESPVPIVAYSVSGEYAMIKAASSQGFINEYQAMCESAVSIYRAGAKILISYYAKELAGAILKGDIG